MKIQIDSGYLVEDPADSHRYMLIAYNAAADRVYVFRRGEISDGPLDDPENQPEAAEEQAAEAKGGELMLEAIKRDYERYGRDLGCYMTSGRVIWLIAEVERLLADIQYALDRLSVKKDQGPGLRVLIDEATGVGDYFPASELKRRKDQIHEINRNFAVHLEFSKGLVSEIDLLRAKLSRAAEGES